MSVVLQFHGDFCVVGYFGWTKDERFMVIVIKESEWRNISLFWGCSCGLFDALIEQLMLSNDGQ